VNNRDKNFTDRKLTARMQQSEESLTRYLTELDRADREPAATIRVEVRHRYPLAAAAEAHRELETRRTAGSVVLLP